MVTPRERLRTWLPHLLLLLLLLAAGAWLLVMISPIREALMMGGSLALLTNPLLFAPLDRRLQALFPTWPGSYRRYFSSLISTLLLATAAGLMALLVLTGLLGQLSGAVHAAIGLAFQNPLEVNRVIDAVSMRSASLLALYPALGLTQEDIRTALRDFLVHSRFGPEFVKMLFTGTGGLIVEIVLTFTTLFYLSSQGSMLAGFLVEQLPLSRARQEALQRRFQRTVQHLLAETLGKALAVGIALGALSWLIAGFNPVLVGLIGIFAGLMPVVGHAFVWLPLASVLASQGRWSMALCLMVASWAASWLIERLSQRLAQAMGTDDSWLSFLIFVSVVGGVMGAGVRGLVMGPAAVITVVVLGEFVASLYGHEAVGERTDKE